MTEPMSPADLDAMIARDEANERASMCTPTEWSLTGYREAPARDGVAWSGTLNKNGTRVGTVSDGGYGGCLDFEWTDAAACRAFTVEARERFGEDRVEVEDRFAHDLATRAQNNKMRKVIFIDDDSNVSRGECYALKSTVTLAQAKAALTNPTGRYAAKNPMIWDKTKSVFVPAADIEV